MVKLHSNQSFLGNISLVVFLAFLVTLTIGMAPQQVQAASPTYDDSLVWEGTSDANPDAVVEDNEGVWQESKAEVTTTDSTSVTLEIQVLTNDFDSIFYKILQGGTVVGTIYSDDLTSVVYNDVYGTAYQVYQVVYDWVYPSGFADNNFSLGVYSLAETLASITLDLEVPPNQSSGGSSGGASSETTSETEVETTTSSDGSMTAGGDQTTTGTPGEEASATIVADSDAIIDQLEHSQVEEVTFVVPEEVTLKSQTTAVTEAAIEVPADTMAAIFEADADVVFDLAGVEIQMPPGAIDMSLFTDQDVTLSFNISKLSEGSTPSPDAVVYKIAGEIYTIEIDAIRNGSSTGHIGSFADPITLALPYDTEELGDLPPESLGIYRLTDGEWESMGGTVNSANGTVEVQRDSLSIYTIMANLDAEVAIESDLTGHWAEAAIKELIALKAMNGYPDGTFKPDDTITRAEFANILVKAFQLEQKGDKVFKDTAKHWAKNSITTAWSHGIIEGYDADTFGPNDLITREQMAVMIVRATALETGVGEVSYTDTPQISVWAIDAVNMVSAVEIMNGYPDNSFKPGGNAKRGEAATVILNALKLK